MGSSGIQIVCVGLGILGLIAAIVTCVLPSWKVSSFTGQNIITAQVCTHTHTYTHTRYRSVCEVLECVCRSLDYSPTGLYSSELHAVLNCTCV